MQLVRGCSSEISSRRSWYELRNNAAQMKISIVTAVYNRAGTVGHALQTLQDQTYSDFEHVVADGGSTDGTLDVLQLGF